MRAQGFIAVVTGLVSLVMAWLVARFINRPVQALRTAMARVATGDLSVRAPVRSADELGELNAALQRHGRRPPHRRAHPRDLRSLREPGGRARRARARRRARRRGDRRDRDVRRPPRLHRDVAAEHAGARRRGADRVLRARRARVRARGRRHHAVPRRRRRRRVRRRRCSRSREHARAAVRAAIALQRALAERNAGPRASRSRPGSASAPATWWPATSARAAA